MPHGGGSVGMSAAPFEDRPLPPVDIEAEQGLLGAILVNNAAYQRVAGWLLAEHFGSAVHGRIYAVIGELIEAGAPADPVTIKHKLGDDPVVVPLGGVGAYLAKLIDSAVTVIGAENYGRIILDAANRRALID